jgi:tetratricopeptide (TPR) repeat protein
MVMLDRIREAAMSGHLSQVEALGPQILDIGERGGLPWRYVGHIYLGLAAHWRGDADRAEAVLREAMALEPPAAFAGQSASFLALHLAFQGRTHEVAELFESVRSGLPTLDRVNGIGSWNCMLGFVEALYLCGLSEQAAALSPLVEGVLALGRRWITLEGRPFETRAGIAAAAAGRWDEAEGHFATARKVAEQMSNRLEVADLRRLHARMLLDRGAADDHARAAEMLDGALQAYRSFGMPTYAAESERLLRQARP